MPPFSEAQLLSQLAGFTWTLLRVSAALVAMPLFAGSNVPRRVRMLLALAIAALIWQQLPPPPAVELFSFGGFLIGIQQIIVGVAMGFVLHMVFAAIVFGGQNISNSMGLGFAAMIDPMSGMQVPVVSQFYQLLATLLFFALDGHLLLLRLVAESFTAVPIGFAGVQPAGLRLLVGWVGQLLAAGVLLALPLTSALLLINLGFGIAGRAAPQLNIFSVGFPIMLVIGLILMGVTLPEVLAVFSGLLDAGIQLIDRILVQR